MNCTTSVSNNIVVIRTIVPTIFGIFSKILPHNLSDFYLPSFVVAKILEVLDCTPKQKRHTGFVYQHEPLKEVIMGTDCQNLYERSVNKLMPNRHLHVYVEDLT